jgi:hypothetical protein
MEDMMDRGNRLFGNQERSGGKATKVQHHMDLSTGEFVTIPKKDGPLPGAGMRRYSRIPTPLALVLGPVLGGLYVLFLPFVGIFMILVLAAKRIVQVLAGSSRALILMLSTQEWAPGRSYLVPRLRNIKRRADKS